MDIVPILNINPESIAPYVDDININYKTPKDVIIGTFIGRTLELKLSKLDGDVPSEITIEKGTTELNKRKQPTFIIKSFENDLDTGEYFIKGMDYSSKFDVPFELDIPDIITNAELAQTICDYVGVEIESLDFANAGFQMTAKKVDSKFNCRDIIAMIAANMGGIAFINSNNKVEFKKITVKNIAIENIFKTQIKNEKIGPINSVVLAREPQKDYINHKDDASIETYGKTEVKITNNWLVDDNREGAIQAIYDNLYGIEFYCAIIESYQGFEVDPFDLVTISGRPVLINNINIKYPLILDGKIGIEQLSKMEIQQNIAKGIEKRVIDAELKVDKVKGQITSVVQEQSSQGNRLTSVEQNIEGISTVISDVNDIKSRTNTIEENVQGLTNTMKETGGLNILHDAPGYFGNDYWKGPVKTIVNTDILDNTRSDIAFDVQNGTIEQTVNVQNGTYTLSGLSKKLLELSNMKITVNDVDINLTEMNWKQFIYTFEVKSRIITIKITSDTNSAGYVADLMLNSGDLPQVFSLNQNETYTDAVKIGKGLTIEATNTDTRLEAGADGIRMRTKTTGNVSTEFTTEGTTTNKLTAQSSLVAGLLTQRINEQVCMNNIGGVM